MSHERRTLLLTVVCFAALYLVWGSTYAAIRVLVETAPPLLAAGLRFVVAGLVLYGVARARGAARPEPRHWGTATITGTLMLAGGTGIVTWAQQQAVPSGIAATVLATNPLWTAAFGWILFGGARPSATVALGLLAGLAGVFAIAVGDGPTEMGAGGPLLVLLLAPAAWSLGALLAGSLPRSGATLLAAGQQMIAGGLTTIAIGVLRGELAHATMSAITRPATLAFCYLLVGGSMLGFTAHEWLVRHVGAARTSTFAFVNPVVALALGAVLFGERLSPRTALGSGLVLVAVVLILWSRMRVAVRETSAGPAWRRSARMGTPKLLRDSA